MANGDNMDQFVYAKSTITQTLIFMGSMLKAARIDKMMKDNVTFGLEIPEPQAKNTRKLPKALTIKEEKLFRKAIENTSNYLQYIFVLETGCRAGEMVGLRWSDIDFYNRVIHINRTMEYRPSLSEWRIGPPKTNSIIRSIPITEKCLEVLLIAKEKNSKLKHIDEKFKDTVFLNRKGSPTKSSTYDSHLVIITKKHGLRHIHMHTLRHTMATRCIESGMPPKTLQEILGHGSISITMNTYVTVTDLAKDVGMKKFQDYQNQIYAS